MNKDSTKITFINHASILIKNDDIGLLSDPWYQGDAFHKGWNLIHEFNDDEVNQLLNEVTHIWISHEHPDHFSIMFFKKFGSKIKERKVKIIFQETSDKRVESFLQKSGFEVIIIKFNKWINLSESFEVLCIKDGFYDSGLAVRTNDKTILNLNDCEIKDDSRCKEVLNIVGRCDVLFSQFSYAAWKGGKSNVLWRKQAAAEKLNTLKLQVKYFKPKVLIPFASYIYFSNEANYYLNDNSNKPEDVLNTFKDDSLRVNIMKPFESFTDLSKPFENDTSLAFWNSAFESTHSGELKKFEKVKLEELESSFKKYQKRIFKNNSKSFMRFVSIFSPIKAFKPIVIKVNDLKLNVNLNIFGTELATTSIEPDISMSSESLNFLLTNTFGFDTLTVNGCFEEESSYGFSKATRSLAIENLNNIGISFKPSILFNFKLIILFINRLIAVSKKIKLSNQH